MTDIITREVSSSDLKELVNKLITDSMSVDITKACQGIYPLHDVHIRKVCFNILFHSIPGIQGIFLKYFSNLNVCCSYLRVTFLKLDHKSSIVLNGIILTIFYFWDFSFDLKYYLFNHFIFINTFSSDLFALMRQTCIPLILQNSIFK